MGFKEKIERDRSYVHHKTVCYLVKVSFRVEFSQKQNDFLTSRDSVAPCPLSVP